MLSFIQITEDKAILDRYGKYIGQLNKNIKCGHYQCITNGELLPNKKNIKYIMWGGTLYYLWPIEPPKVKQNYIYSRRHLV